MLQPTPLQPATSFPPQDGSGQRGVGELVDFALGFLLRQYLVILLLVLLAGVVGAIFLVVTPPTYTAEAKIFIGTQKAEFVQQQSLFAEAPIDNAQIETQIEILLSKAIVASVVQKLKLGDDPEFASPPVGLISWVLQVFNNPTAAEPKLDTETAIATLADGLTVKRVGFSFLLEIGVSARSPEKSAQIANAIADAYIIEDQQEVKRQANRIASKWLQERLRELSGQSAAADQAVVESKQQNNIVSAAGKRMDEQNLADLNTRLVDARTHTSDALARLTRIESIIRSWDPKATLDASVSDELSNTILINLRQQYLDLSRREAEYSAKYGRDHQVVVNLRNRLRELRTSAFDEVRRIAETFKSDYAIAKQRQTEVENQLNQVISETQTANTAQARLRELESAAATYHSLYESFFQRYTGAVQQDTFPLPEARLTSLASALAIKVKPKPIIIFPLFFIGGIALGVGVGFLRDLMDRVFRTRNQVQSLLQIPCIAMVPLLKTSASRRTWQATPEGESICLRLCQSLTPGQPLTWWTA